MQATLRHIGFVELLGTATMKSTPFNLKVEKSYKVSV